MYSKIVLKHFPMIYYQKMSDLCICSIDPYTRVFMKISPMKRGHMQKVFKEPCCHGYALLKKKGIKIKERMKEEL